VITGIFIGEQTPTKDLSKLLSPFVWPTRNNFVARC